MVHELAKCLNGNSGMGLEFLEEVGKCNHTHLTFNGMQLPLWNQINL